MQALGSNCQQNSSQGKAHILQNVIFFNGHNISYAKVIVVGLKLIYGFTASGFSTFNQSVKVIYGEDNEGIEAIVQFSLVQFSGQNIQFSNTKYVFCVL